MRKLMCCLTSVLVLVMLLGFSIGVVQAGKCELPDFASAKFSNPTRIDNPYFPLNPELPLVPGKTFEYQPVPNEDDVVNTMTVTDCTKQITVDGKTIDCLVVYDVETVGGSKSEETWDWYAQDDEGNVWYLGEYTKAYDEPGSSSFSTEGSWEAGKDVADLGVTALPGYLIPAEDALAPGICYQQEFYEGEAEDKAKVLRLNAEVNLENGDSYEDCPVTKEWSLDSGNVEHKYYASGVGLVLIRELKEKTVRVELVEISDDSTWTCPEE